MIGVPGPVNDGDTVIGKGGRLVTTSEAGQGFRSLISGFILSLAGVFTQPRTWTFPDRSDTVAGLAANTFSALQTFGAGLTVTAGTITLPSFSLPDNALSTNVCILNANQTFTAGKIFRNSLGVRFEQAGTQDAVVIQGGAGGTTSLTATITTEAALTGSFAYRLPTLAANDTFAMRGLANTFSAAQTFGDKISQTYTGNSAPGNQGVSVAGDHLTLFDALSHDYRLGVDSVGGSWIKSLNSSGATFKIYTSPSGGVATLAIWVDAAQNTGFGGVTPTAGNGVIQTPSGMTKATGIAFGTDTFIYRDAANSLTTDGDFRISAAGKGLRIKEGTNARMGAAVLVAGTVVVANTSVTANSRIQLTTNVVGGTVGFLVVSARTAGTSFTILSSSATDTSTVAWEIKEPA